MRITSPIHLHGPQGLNPPHHVSGVKNVSSPTEAQHASGDRLDISPAAEAAAQAAGVGETSEAAGVRHELVARIKQQIASGTYETPEKLDIALDRLLDEIA